MSPSFVLPRRGGFLALLVGVALATALATGLFDTGHSSSAAIGQAGHSHAAPGANKAQADFQDQMRKLWEDHVTWTRLAIVTFADGSAGFDATATRLLQNQDDIGDAIKPFYGEEAGNELTALLEEHIQGAVDLLAAAKSGDQTAVEVASANWYANANQIAAFLSRANPEAWPLDDLQAEMTMHLDLTLEEATARLQGDPRGRPRCAR